MVYKFREGLFVTAGNRKYECWTILCYPSNWEMVVQFLDVGFITIAGVDIIIIVHEMSKETHTYWKMQVAGAGLYAN